MHVAKASQEELIAVELEFVQGLHEGELRPTELVGLDRVDHESLECRLQIGSEGGEQSLAGDLRSFRDGEVGLVGKETANLREMLCARIFLADRLQAGQLGFEAAYFGQERTLSS